MGDLLDNIEALKQAVLGAGNIQSPASSLGASQGPELAALYQSTFQLPQSSGATSAIGQQTQDIVSAQKAAAAAARAAAKKKEWDPTEPRNYKRVKKSDGGYDFFDKDGKPVDIATLTQRTGTKPSEWIDDSENPIDIQYREDYNNLQDYASAVLSGNRKKVDAYRKSEPGLSRYDGRSGIDNLMREFQSSYKRYYVPSAYGYAPGKTVVPAPTTGNNYGFGDTAEVGS